MLSENNLEFPVTTPTSFSKGISHLRPLLLLALTKCFRVYLNGTICFTRILDSKESKTMSYTKVPLLARSSKKTPRKPEENDLNTGNTLICFKLNITTISLTFPCTTQSDTKINNVLSISTKEYIQLQ